ncbi:hypothetical protein NQZ79_g7192 [Umbelopsis isabellina]|nr:hypothetical protein NQZ79_g7192 [Umbelopsis isabellina]
MAKPAPNKLLNNPFFANRHQPVIKADQADAAISPGKLKNKWQPVANPKKEDNTDSKPIPVPIERSESNPPVKLSEQHTPNVPELKSQPPAPVQEERSVPKSPNPAASQAESKEQDQITISKISKLETAENDEPVTRKSFISTASLESPLPWQNFENVERSRLSLPSISNVADDIDGMLMQLLVSQAVIDAKDFEVLTLEEVETLKQQHISLMNRLEDQTARLSLESKMREASQSLVRLHSTNRKMALQSQEQLIASTQKVDEVAKEVWRLTRLGSETQQRLLEHTAGTLSVGVKVLEDELSAQLRKDASRPTTQTTANADTRIKQLKIDLVQRDNEIKRQQDEIEQLRSQKLCDMEFETSSDVQAKEREIRELRTEYEHLHNGLDFLVRRYQIAEDSIPIQPSDAGTISSASEDSGSWDGVHGGNDFGFKSVHTSTTSMSDVRNNEYSLHHGSVHTATLNSVEKLLKEAELKVRRLESEAEDSRMALAQSQQKIIELQQNDQSDDYLQSLKALTAQRAQLQQELESLRTENNRILTEADKSHKKNASLLEQEVALTRQQLEKLEIDLYGLTEMFPVQKSNNLHGDKTPLELAAFKIRDIVQENMRIEETMSHMEASIKEHEQERDDLMTELQTTRKQLQAVSTRASSPAVDTRAIEARERALQRELQQFKSEVFDLRSQREEWERNVNNQSAVELTKEQVDEQIANINARHEAQIIAIQQELKLVRDQLEITEQEKQRLQCEAESLERQFKANKQAMDKMKNEINLKESSFSTIQLELDSVKENLIAKTKEEERLFASEQQIHKNHELQTQMLKQELTDLANKMRQNANQAEELISSKNQRLMAANEHIERLENDISQLRNRASNTITAQPQQSGELQSLRSQMDEICRSRDMIEMELGITQKQLRETQEALLTAQSQFTVRESALLLQCSSIETDFEAIFKEYERLTRNITDFASERHAYDERIRELLQYKNEIQTELADEKVRCLQVGKEPNSTQTLRREFRKLMSEVKAEHVRELERAEEERKKLDAVLRNLRREEEKKRWEKQSRGVQTNFVVDLVSR